MRLIRAKDYQDMSRKAANIISAQVILKPESVLGLATGSTPIGIYHQLIDWYKKGDVDFSRVVSINLDEYCGLSDSNPQSYSRFMREHFFDYINISRCRLAYSFYVDNGYTVSESARSAGFENLSYFNRVFKQKYSMTPRQFRKESQ